MDLLEPDVPLGLPADVPARKKILQADALCRLHQPGKAEAILAETDATFPIQHTAVEAELALTRGRCASLSSQETAKQYFSAAASLAHGNDEFIEATGLLNVGYVLLGEGRQDEAIDKFLQGLKVSGSPLLQDRMLGNLGFVYSERGDWKEARSFSQQAVEMAVRIKNLEAQEKWLIDLGKENYALWEMSEAEADDLKALAIAQQVHDRAGSAVCLNALTRVAIRRRDISAAERYLAQGEAIHEDGERLHFALDAAEIAAAQARWTDAEKMFSGVAGIKKADPILRCMAQRGLGEVYWSRNKIVDADHAFRAEIEIAEAAMARLTSVERRMSFLDEERFYDSYIRFLAAEGRTTEALGIAERGRAQVWLQDVAGNNTPRVSASLSATQANLKRHNQVALVYWVTDEASFLWVISPRRFELFKLPGHLDLYRMIEAYNRELQDHHDPEDSPAARKLYDALIGPAEKLIPKGSHVIVVPSKVLSTVSFESLVAPAPQPHYWIEDAEVQVAGSLARIPKSDSARRTTSSHARELLLLGAPLEASADFPSLKSAPEEIRRVQSHFAAEQRTVISGKDATPEAYSTAGPGAYRLIHLDTHGTASDLRPLDSAIILSPGSGNAYKLYAREIRNVPLHADLVTISACYGAGTRWYNNEGVVGLGWAFLHAGARQVIAALWEVDDASSPQLMDDFYGELAQGKSPAEALHDAKLKMLRSSDFHRHPYYWASLQLYTGS